MLTLIATNNDVLVLRQFAKRFAELVHNSRAFSNK